MKIIGFGHESRMGKNTASNLLISHIRALKRNVLVVKTGFSSKPKAICHDLYGWAGMMDEEYYETHESERNKILSIGKCPVDIWIEFETNVGRAVYSDTWIEYPFARYSNADYLILKDVRFENEVNSILKRGGSVFKIIDPRKQPRDSVADKALKDFTGWTGTIINDGDIKDLNRKVIELCDSVVKL